MTHTLDRAMDTWQRVNANGLNAAQPDERAALCTAFENKAFRDAVLASLANVQVKPSAIDAGDTNAVNDVREFTSALVLSAEAGVAPEDGVAQRASATLTALWESGHASIAARDQLTITNAFIAFWSYNPAEMVTQLSRVSATPATPDAHAFAGLLMAAYRRGIAPGWMQRLAAESRA